MKKVEYWDMHGLFVKWKAYLRERRGEKVKVAAVQMYSKRKMWGQWKTAYGLDSKISRFQRLKVMRKARFAVAHWSSLAKRKKRARAMMGKVNEKANLKNLMLRWKRYTRMSCLPKGEVRMGKTLYSDDDDLMTLERH
jgi:hypothetical protein